jgi:hypothetical protein
LAQVEAPGKRAVALRRTRRGWKTLFDARAALH